MPRSLESAVIGSKQGNNSIPDWMYRSPESGGAAEACFICEILQPCAPILVFKPCNFPAPPYWFIFDGFVYTQIIRSNKSLCVITEAHDLLRNLWICKRCLEYCYLWLKTKIMLVCISFQIIGPISFGRFFLVVAMCIHIYLFVFLLFMSLF